MDRARTWQRQRPQFQFGLVVVLVHHLHSRYHHTMFASLHLRRPTNAFPTPPAPPIVIAGSSSSSAGPSRLHSTPLSGSSRPSHPESQSQSARPQPAQSIRPARPAEPHGAAPGTGARAVAAVKGRTREEKYFARVANENILPNKLHKGLGIGGWVLGVCECG